MYKFPLDIEKLIYTFIPDKCDWCSSECNYEIIDYVKKNISNRLLDPLEFPMKHRANILSLFALTGNASYRENAYICRLCKLNKFNFDDKFMWSRDYRNENEEDIISLYPRISLRSFEYNIYGREVNEPIMMMSDRKWNIASDSTRRNTPYMVRDVVGDEIEEVD